MMNETEFHRLANETLESIADALEDADQSGALDVEYENDAVAIGLPSKKQLLLTKHAPTSQLWLASPSQGGLHFAWDGASHKWKLADGRELKSLLVQEISTAGIKVTL